MNLDEIGWLLSWLGVLYTSVGIIVMLIIAGRHENFIENKIVEFGTALKILEKIKDGKIIKGDGGICVQTSSGIVREPVVTTSNL